MQLLPGCFSPAPKQSFAYAVADVEIDVTERCPSPISHDQSKGTFCVYQLNFPALKLQIVRHARRERGETGIRLGRWPGGHKGI